MALCERCRKRKAKRFCIALNQSLCPLCCGRLREKEVSCPPECTFLQAHRPYQEKRIVSKKPDISSRDISPDKDPLSDERLAWLALHIEMPLKEQAEQNTNFRDKDALLALEYARDVVQEEKALVFTSESQTLRRSPLGEAVVQSIHNCRFERKIVIPGDNPHYTSEEKIICLDRIILSIKNLMQNDLESTAYLTQIAERFSKIQSLARQKKILIPG